MNFGPLIWFIFIVIWIISALAKKKEAEVKREEKKEEFPSLPEIKPLVEREEYEEIPPTPEETLESFLRRLAGEEEKREAPPLPEIKPVVEPVEVPPALEIKEPPPRVRIPPPEEKEEIREPILESADLETLRQGIILAEILGPPRAGQPL